MFSQLISPDIVPQSGAEPEACDHTPMPPPIQFNEESLAMDGEYMLSYNTLKPIGKGAFGFVSVCSTKGGRIDGKCGHMYILIWFSAMYVQSVYHISLKSTHAWGCINFKSLIP